jgi:hypothetical protein
VFLSPVIFAFPNIWLQARDPRWLGQHPVWITSTDKGSQARGSHRPQVSLCLIYFWLLLAEAPILGPMWDAKGRSPQGTKSDLLEGIQMSVWG